MYWVETCLVVSISLELRDEIIHGEWVRGRGGEAGLGLEVGGKP